MNKVIVVLMMMGIVACHSATAQTNVIGTTGAVGIGTTTPIAGSWLHVYRNAAGNYNPIAMFQDALVGGFTQLGIKGTGITFHMGVGNSGAAFGLSDKFFIWDQSAVLPRMVIDRNGSVGIGTTNTNEDYKLFVEGAIRTRKVKVDQDTWPDYVFEPEYRLPSLSQVEQFIISNKHLPEMPSAADVDKDGLDLGATQSVLLKKVEELTLYLIEQDKRLKEQEREIKELKGMTR